MSRVSTYLNFRRTTEKAFEFYKSIEMPLSDMFWGGNFGRLRSVRDQVDVQLRREGLSRPTRPSCSPATTASVRRPRS